MSAGKGLRDGLDRRSGPLWDRFDRIVTLGEGFVQWPLLHRCASGSLKLWGTYTLSAGFRITVLVLDCDNTRYVIPAGLKRESIDFPGYPLSRV
jgi:hypothetical protein